MDEDDSLDGMVRLFARGVADRRSAFHTPTIATIDEDGAPCMRTVVLRSFDAPTRTLSFHTDVRTAKVAHLRQRPSIAVHVYDAGHKLQVRCGGTATLHASGAIADTAWAAASDGSRRTYRIEDTPGTAVADPSAVRFEALSEIEARANFLVVRVQLLSLEWLRLASAGHRRRLYRFGGNAVIRSDWLAP